MVKLEQSEGLENRAPTAPPLRRRPRLLVISHVLPFPGSSGQQQRVANTLKAARSVFEIHFLTFAARSRIPEIRSRLLEFSDCAIVLESAWEAGRSRRLLHNVIALIFMALSGLKKSNYQVGRVEFTQRRLRENLALDDYDCVLYEYFHAFESASVFQKSHTPTVLDTHNILWRAREMELQIQENVPKWLKSRLLRQYRQVEETAWLEFDGLVAINRKEFSCLKQSLPETQRVFYAPMGIDLVDWSYCWQPVAPPRVAYYAGFGSSYNQAAALRCYNRIMPAIWKKFPRAELWLIGSNPPECLRSLTSDSRVKVTGFVEKVQEVLRTVSLVLCPWSGTYGFRSRIVEVMALGVPVVATPDAVDGMELESGRGIVLADTDEAFTEAVLKLLSESDWIEAQSRLARAEMERLYSLENTYGRLMTELRDWVESRKQK